MGGLDIAADLLYSVCMSSTVPEADLRGWLTAVQVADLIGVRPSTWRAYVARGHAPSARRRVGHVHLWARSDIEQWQRERPGPGRWGPRA